MPVATKPEGTEMFDLKSAPPDGYVVLQRMGYGDSVQRRSMMKLSIESGGNTKDFKGELAMASVEIQQFEFIACIVDHNLTDPSERKLDFRALSDLRQLDSRIGQEIEELISKQNDFNDDDEGNSPSGALLSSVKDEEATN